MTILHLAHREDWLNAQASGEYRVSTRGKTLDEVGFIHASYPEQITRMAEAIYAGDTSELCVLVLDDEVIRTAGVRVVDEDGGKGELFPHIYAAIKPSWVVEVLDAGFDPAGKFHYQGS